MSVVISLLRQIQGVLSELCHFGFPLLRRSKGSTLDSGLPAARTEKISPKARQSAQFLPRIKVERFKRSFSVRFQLEYVPIAHITKLRIQLNSPSWFSKHAAMRRHGHIRGSNRMSGQKNYPDQGTDRRIVSTKSTFSHANLYKYEPL